MSSATAEKTKPQMDKAPPGGKKTAVKEHPGRATRETIESVVIAIILAFLFRTFEAEAFVIPTGSMAPTLMGRHRDVACPECGYRYRSGASEEDMPINDLDRPEIVATVCPICRYTHVLNKVDNPNEDSFTGDRILVSKFAYQIGEPERWDPIVFKFPGNPKQNYIKRLVGLPGEHGRIFHGDVYAKGPGDAQEHILRKPPHKVLAILQLVDDTNYIPAKLLEVDWPSRWQTWNAREVDTPAPWKMSPDHRSFTTQGQGGTSWIRYKHLAPFEQDWTHISAGQLPPDMRAEDSKRRGTLISDFYTYNVNYTIDRNPNPHLAPQWENAAYERVKWLPREEYEKFIRNNAVDRSTRTELREVFNPGAKPALLGRHWVGDLAVEAEVSVASTSGEVLLDLIEGGRHHTCRIDVATGIAKLEMDGGKVPFVTDDGKETASPEATTDLRGPGTYQVRLSNCDDEVLLWINGSIVTFNAPTTYATRPDCEPQCDLNGDHLDLAPAGIGTNGASFTVTSMRILRDVYYIASGRDANVDSPVHLSPEDLAEVFSTPSRWEESQIFSSRESLPFVTEADQFFPLGDNSPASQDARSWKNGQQNNPNTPPFVPRELLIGKALLIYWPHAWNRPVPFTPNVQRMGVIK